MLLYLVIDHIQDKLTGELGNSLHPLNGCYGKLHVKFTVADESQTVILSYNAHSKKWQPSSKSSKASNKSAVASMIWSNLDFYGQEKIKISVERLFFGVSSASSNPPTTAPAQKQPSSETSNTPANVKEIRLNDLYVVQQHGEYDTNSNSSSDSGSGSDDDADKKQVHSGEGQKEEKEIEKENHRTFCFEYSIPWTHHQHPFLTEPQIPPQSAVAINENANTKAAYSAVETKKQDTGTIAVSAATSTVSSAASDEEDEGGRSHSPHDFKIHLRFRFIFEDKCLPLAARILSATANGSNRNSTNRFGYRNYSRPNGLTSTNLRNSQGSSSNNSFSPRPFGGLGGSRDSHNSNNSNNSVRNPRLVPPGGEISRSGLASNNSDEDFMRMLQALSRNAGMDDNSSDSAHLSAADIALVMDNNLPENSGGDSPGSSNSMMRKKPSKLTELHKVMLYGDVELFITLLRDLAYTGKLKDALQYAPMPSKRSTSSTSSTAISSKSMIASTALHVCLLHGRCDMLQELLSRAGQWAFIELASQQSSPLHAAIVGGCVDCFRILIKFVKKISKIDDAFARKFGLRVMLEHRDAADHTPLSLACSLAEDRSCMVEMLLKLNADCSVIVCDGRETALTLACRHGFKPVIRLLLSVIVQPENEIPTVGGSSANRATTEAPELAYSVFNTNNSFTTTSLDRERDSIWQRCHFYAFMSCGRWLRCQQNRRRHSKTFTKKLPTSLPIASFKCSPSFMNPVSGEQAMHIAARHGHIDVIKILISIGLPWYSLNNKGENLFHIAVSTKNHDLMSELIQLEKKRYAIMLEVSQERMLQDMKPIERVMTKPNVFGQTPLYLAKQQNDDELVTMLVENIKKVYDIDTSAKNKVDDDEDVMISAKDEDGNEYPNEGKIFVGVLHGDVLMYYEIGPNPVAFIDDEGYDFALTALYKKQMNVH